jgi:hypothetical protein
MRESTGGGCETISQWFTDSDFLSGILSIQLSIQSIRRHIPGQLLREKGYAAVIFSSG